MEASFLKINSLLLLLIACSLILCAASRASVDTVVVVNETESTVLECKTFSEDRQQTYVRVIWRKDGKVLREAKLDQSSESVDIFGSQIVDSFVRENFRIMLVKQNGSLVLNSVIASDSGFYMCEVESNDAQPINSGITELKINEFLKFMPQPTSKNLELGTTGKVHCKAQGTPPPRIKWFMGQSAALPVHVSDLNGTLTFQNASAEHRGNYTCVATNSQGIINATVSINVVIAPKFIVKPVGPIELAELGPAFMHCQATGNPKPTVQWDKDLQYLNENNTDKERFIFHSNGTLEIRMVNVDDEGHYGCTIGSSAGLKREEVLLIVQNKSNSLVTRIIIIVICLAFLYFVLILSLKLCCRNRRQLGKMNLNEDEHRDEAGAGGEDEEHAENEPWLASTSRNPNIVKVKKLCDSTIIEQDSCQVADDIV